jgi:vitamin B12 transporter
MSWLYLLLFPFIVSAGELEPIDVEATKDIERFTFVTSSTITEQQLEKETLGLVSTSIEKVPGVIANQNGGPGGRVSYFIRGTESRHVSFTLDGLKINDTSNVDRQFDAAFLTSAFAKSITVHKGPQAVLYGSDALGGMIEIKSRKGDNAPETRLNMNGGSFGTVGTSLSNDWRNEKNNGTLSYSRFHSDGISRLNEKRFDADERDSTDITQLMSSSEHRWGSRVQTDFLASYVHGKADQDAFVSDNSYDYSRNDQYLLQQKTNYELSKTQGISLRNGLNRHQRHNRSLSSGAEFFNGDLIQNEFIHRLELNSFGLLSGAATEHEASKAIGTDRSFDLHSLFTQGSFEEGKWKLHAGVRSDRHSRYGSFYTGSGGIAYANFSFQYSQGYKAPTLYQLYGPDSFGAPVGNPNLVPETNHYFEAAWKKVTEDFEAGLALFQNRLSNQFTYSFTQGYINQQRFITEGVEFSGKLKRRSYELSSSFTHQNFREEESPVLRRPYNSAIVSASLFPTDTLELNITERWFSSRKDFGTAGVTKLNGYEVMDIGVRKIWERDEFGIQVKNVLNREYEEIFGFNVLPRSLFANYGHRF